MHHVIMHIQYCLKERLVCIVKLFSDALSSLAAVYLRRLHLAGNRSALLECGMLGVGFLDSVKLHSAREGGGHTPAITVEQCECPDGYVGQFCESCAPGYRRDPPGTSPLSRCIPCNCNRHSDACDVTTGAL